MRRFRDERGEEWDVTVGRESWGTQVLIFSPRSGGDVRKSVLRSESQLAAERELQAMDDDQLRERLRSGEPWG